MTVEQWKGKDAPTGNNVGSRCVKALARKKKGRIHFSISCLKDICTRVITIKRNIDNILLCIKTAIGFEIKEEKVYGKIKTKENTKGKIMNSKEELLVSIVRHAPAPAMLTGLIHEPERKLVLLACTGNTWARGLPPAWELGPPLYPTLQGPSRIHGQTHNDRPAALGSVRRRPAGASDLTRLGCSCRRRALVWQCAGRLAGVCSSWCWTGPARRPHGSGAGQEHVESLRFVFLVISVSSGFHDHDHDHQSPL
jgi:hypothetical protein